MVQMGAFFDMRGVLLVKVCCDVRVAKAVESEIVFQRNENLYFECRLI